MAADRYHNGGLRTGACVGFVRLRQTPNAHHSICQMGYRSNPDRVVAGRFSELALQRSQL